MIHKKKFEIFKIKKHNFVMHCHKFGGALMAKKIFILVVALSALIITGYNYFLSSSAKHKQFLLEQSLFPHFTRTSQGQALPLEPLKTELQDSEFKLILKSKNSNPENYELLREAAGRIVEEWQSTQSEFNQYDFNIVFEDELKSKDKAQTP